MANSLEQSGDAQRASMQSAEAKNNTPATAKASAEDEYPPFKTVLATVLGMMCVSLLVALVSSSPYSPQPIPPN